MKITVIAVGKIKEKFFEQAVAEYGKRLGSYCKLEIVQVADEKTPDRLDGSLAEQVKEKEGARILSHVKDGAYVIALAVEGKMMSSEELGRQNRQPRHRRRKPYSVYYRRLTGAFGGRHAAGRFFLELFQDDVSPPAHAGDPFGADLQELPDQPGDAVS